MQHEEEADLEETALTFIPILPSPYPVCIQKDRDYDDPEPGLTVSKLQFITLCVIGVVLIVCFLLALRA